MKYLLAGYALTTILSLILVHAAMVEDSGEFLRAAQLFCIFGGTTLLGHAAWVVRRLVRS